MTGREHPRRRGLLGRRAALPSGLQDLVGPYVAGGQAPTPEDVAAAVAEDELAAAVDEALAPPPLSLAQVTRLEALTAQWVREVRVGGPGPDDTLLYPAASSKPAPPAARRPVDPTAATDLDGLLRGLEAEAAGRHAAPDVSRETTPAGPPARVSDWASRHDARSLQYAVRARLQRPASVHDFRLELGPVLDQGTTPPLSLRDASACTGMAAVAAANVLEFQERGERWEHPVRHSILGVEDARAAYALAQDRDHLSGREYAGTSVLAVMKAGRELGWWDGYLWALGGTRDVAQALLQLRAPVVVGLPWPASLEDPDAAGIIAPDGPANGMGHALAVVGIRAGLTRREAAAARAPLPGPYFELQQSRGTSEGVGGLVLLHHTHLGQLLAGVGEAAVPIRAGMLE